jgi:Fic family protein
MLPGMFKQMNNRAGDTVFVDARLVQGTLAKGFQRYEALQDPVARAIFMMFMISEVHPFNDGNGRMARVMMNAELVHADQCRIIVPTVFRIDYLLTLRKLSRQKNPEAYIQVMQKLHAFSQNLYGSDYEALNRYLVSCNAFADPESARLKMIDRVDTE